VITVRSYCTGYGGLELATRAVLGELELLSVCDVKPASAALLAQRWPDTANLGDMRSVDPAARRHVEPELVLGSWPCQPHSAAGRRLGRHDSRDLWPEFLRIITATRPAMFFGENVARITVSGELRRVTDSLGQLGYGGAWTVTRASDTGVCHRRARCFVLAVHDARYASHWDDVSLPEPVTSTPRLLPTPKASDGPHGGPGMRGSSHDLMLPSAVMPHNFGRYESAVRRHADVLDRDHPAPTTPIPRSGAPQLSARFVEWMMCLPSGWVSDVPDLTRNAQISLLGDGVVPAQAESALRALARHLGIPHEHLAGHRP
jgi:DNA (cytosine-5)-methyltransferase 1